MKSAVHVQTPPEKPTLVFDGDCNFCAYWIRRWQQTTGDQVDYLAAQNPGIAGQFPEIPRDQFDTAVQLIETDGVVYSGAEAVFRTLAQNPDYRWPLNIYSRWPAVAWLAESAYRWVAENRTLFSRLTRWLWGSSPEPPTYALINWIFLRALGLIYLIAFVSLWTQIDGLIGHDGILPADELMPAISHQFDLQGIGWERYHQWPTLCWFDSSDGFLHFQCAAGTVLAALLIVGVAPVPCLVLLWLLYLSLATINLVFLGFQWDNLLLETGFLAIFFAPLHWRPRAAAPSRLVLWWLRLLLFKLMFSSGCVKWLSADPSWRNLTALTFHYQTQPLPIWTAWYANQLPLWFQKFSCAGMFAIELGAPWLIFAPRRLRFLGAAALAALQFLIMLTGNYTFFNWLALALCLLLLDDQALRPRKLARLFRPARPSTQSGWPAKAIIPLTIVVILLTVAQIASVFGIPSVVAAGLAPFRSFNSYGLFAVMTTTRHEIEVEGSDDGVHWLAYEFKYKPGDVNRPPSLVAPFQPRLDWQMWFAALGTYQDNPWLVRFCERLLQGSPDVLALLAKNPFPQKPPRFVRASLYDYRFTNTAERHASGAWWKREFIGEYLPPISIER